MAEKPNTRSLSVTESLREQLLAGAFPPESRLQEVALAERMAVSRTPIREALRVLAQDGLLTYQPNKGYLVRRFALEDILKVFRVRAVLEGLGARIAAEQGLKPKQQQAIEDALNWGDRLLALGESSPAFCDEWRDMNTQFHLAVLEAADNELLYRFAGTSRKVPVVFNGSFRFYTEQDFRRSMDHHHVIYDAISKGQGERADMMMQEHIYHAREIIAANFDKVFAPDLTD
ncbi:MAG: GntR family transcriptional regulator [Ketobacteraceae bacterium]|nr:GntR family transcriptional regulator [Ketobacteraceae bacterium]